MFDQLRDRSSQLWWALQDTLASSRRIVAVLIVAAAVGLGVFAWRASSPDGPGSRASVRDAASAPGTVPPAVVDVAAFARTVEAEASGAEPSWTASDVEELAARRAELGAVVPVVEPYGEGAVELSSGSVVMCVDLVRALAADGSCASQPPREVPTP